MISLFNKVACFVRKQKKMFASSKVPDLRWSVQGGKIYCVFHISKGSLVDHGQAVADTTLEDAICMTCTYHAVPSNTA